MALSSSALPTDLVELFEGGASIVMATRDGKLRPEVARACGALVDRAQRRITVFLAESVAARTVANLAENRDLAVLFTEIFRHRSIQTKGKVVSVERAAEVHQDAIKRYMGAWSEVLASASTQSRRVAMERRASARRSASAKGSLAPSRASAASCAWPASARSFATAKRSARAFSARAARAI